VQQALSDYWQLARKHEASSGQFVWFGSLLGFPPPTPSCRSWWHYGPQATRHRRRTTSGVRMIPS